MKVRLFEGLAGAGDVATTRTVDVADGQSIIFITPSGITRDLYARFYDIAGVVHQVKAESIVSVDPS